MTEAHVLNAAGKCARCGRLLRRQFVVEGIAYGPVCVVRLFGRLPGKPKAARQVKEPEVNKEQLQFFTEVQG